MDSSKLNENDGFFYAKSSGGLLFEPQFTRWGKDILFDRKVSQSNNIFPHREECQEFCNSLNCLIMDAVTKQKNII